MNVFRFLPRAATRLKLGVLLCAVLMGSSMVGLAQTSGSSSDDNGTTPTINNPKGHNVSTGNYIPPPPPSGPEVYYNHRWDLYAGAGYTNFLAGPQLIQRSNLGGWEAAASYWLGWHWGIAADTRQYIGTSGVFPNANGGQYNPTCPPSNQSCYNNPTITGPRIMQYYFMAGPEYRLFRDAKASATIHALVGDAWGIFDAANLHGIDPRTLGLFATQWTIASAFGGTFDYNYSPRIAFRAQPELLFTRYGGTAQQNFGFSVGPLIRLGHLDTSGRSTPSGRKGQHFHSPFHR
jgi:hypothetical protein